MEAVGQPHLLAGAALLGATATDAEGVAVGAVEDVLIAPSTGAVAGIVAAFRQPDGVETRVVAEYDSISWGEDTPPTPVLVLECAQDHVARPAGLFEDQELSRVTGEVTRVETPRDHACSALVLKVHDEDNLLHRVLVEPALLLGSSFPRVEIGLSLTAEGVFTRDASGKLLVASALSQDGERLELRDASGALSWPVLKERLISGRGLAGQRVRAADGSSLEMRGWILDRASGLIPFVSLEVDGTGRALPWFELERDEGTGGWTVGLDRAGSSRLPAVSNDGQVMDGS